MAAIQTAILAGLPYQTLRDAVRMAAKLCLPAAPGKNDQIDRSPSVRPFLRPRLGEGHTAYALAGP
jgi:hypothetical protein